MRIIAASPLQSLWETIGYGPITTLSSTDNRRPGTNDDYYSAQGVEAIAKLGRKWLSECRALHKQCNDASQEGHPDHGTSHIIPTRLVDVGLDGDEMFPRLTITNGSGLYSGYATLSYAWGDENPGIKTTSSNIQEMTRKIDPSDLSKTIREAVIMARKLGIRYLWVDALCILQSRGSDDAQHELDWQQEAARFGQYYENSILTIAATGAQSASEGLFLHRAGQMGSFQPHTVRWTDGSDVPREVTFYPKVPCWEDEIMGSPLASRGWAAQERLMSRRILHFAANCVCWECYELKATEGDPAGCVLGNAPGLMPRKGTDLEKSVHCLVTIPPERITRMWYEYIEAYSQKRFTHVSDRLPASSALASRVQSITPHQYLEGIWAETSVTGLAWRSFDYNWADGPKEAAIPSWSWSWASARGSVNFSITPKYQVAEITFSPNDKPNFGILGQASMQLRARSKIIIANLSTLNLTPVKFLSSNSMGRPFHDSLSKYPEFLTLLFLDRLYTEDFTSNSFYCFLLGKVHVESYIIQWMECLTDLGLRWVGVALVLEPTGRAKDKVEEFRRIRILYLPLDEYEDAGMEERVIDIV
ncbi:Heterokaryon incompatibility protein (HET) domain containing protein [Rhypophila sp. PSN 637]